MYSKAERDAHFTRRIIVDPERPDAGDRIDISS